MSSEPRRFGLLIGVGEYPRIGESARLLGPAQDVRALKRVLVRSYGFDPQDLQTLLDAEATREAILELLVRRNGEEDLAVLFVTHDPAMLRGVVREILHVAEGGVEHRPALELAPIPRP